jgi:MoaA/NifB/PqqE/SkfB family radical SAM enzyme
MESLCKKIKNKQVAFIFGYSSFGKRIFEKIKSLHLDVTIFFCDNSSKKQGSMPEGYVYSVQDANNKHAGSVFILASIYHSKSMYEQLKTLGIKDEDIIRELPDELLSEEKRLEQSNRLERKERLWFEINIAKHCNLNCKGCDHFSPVAKEEFYNLDILKKDLQRLSHIFAKKVDGIYLLCGEPLLCPDITKYMKIVRGNFPEAEIFILTNGILLTTMKLEFWSACKLYGIGIMPTRYPIKVDYERLRLLAEAHGVRFEYFGSSESGRTLWHFPLDLEGKQNPADSFANCRNANSCITLEKGKLYTCSIAANIEIFNNYFNQKLELAESDGVDIYQLNTAKEVMEALAKPMSFCRYCDVKSRTYDHQWELSKRDIKEWS